MSKKPLPPHILERCRNFRQDCTEVEKLMWKLLRNRQIAGAKFRRQHPIKNYILDFYCEEAKLAIELDGGQHTEPQNVKHDERRTLVLQQQGIRILRFWNFEVFTNTEGVIETIWEALQDS